MEEGYSLESLRCAAAEPGRVLVSSLDANWTSLLLQTVRSPGQVECFDTLPTPDQLIVVVQQGVYDIESVSGRSTSKARYYPGCGGMTAPGNTSRLCWSSPTDATLQTIHVYVPMTYFLEAAEECRAIGQPTARQPDVLGFEDPAIYQALQALSSHAHARFPNLYAESAAGFLATHLILQGTNSSRGRKTPPANHELTDRRLKRVLEYMNNNFCSDMSISTLAREAGVSRFHFARLFKASIGTTPGRYLLQLRMQHARKLLQTTDMNISLVAEACGYTHSGYFAAMFARFYSCSPLVFRHRALLRAPSCD